MQAGGLDALIVCGSQYAGFEGAVFYTSGFEIVHRYVYVLIPLEEEPTLVFPREARWIGDKKKPWVKDQVWPNIPGQWLRDRAAERKWKRIGTFGMNFVMAVRDYRELAQGSFELVPFDQEFDMARAVKSEEELVEVRDAMDIVVDGFWALIAYYKVPGHRKVAGDDLLLYSLEVTGAGGYWVEFSRALIQGEPSSTTQKMADAYPHAMESARKLMRHGELASSVHRAVADTFGKHGFALGHLSGHSIGMTMLEYPAIGAKTDVPLEENMIFSLHPQVVDQDGKVCLYTQDTYRLGKTEGECLADVPWKFYKGGETRESVKRG